MFIKIYEYFYRSDNSLKIKGGDLFGKLEKGLLKEVDRLEQHIALGDYSFVFSV